MWQNLSFLSVDGSFFPFHDRDISSFKNQGAIVLFSLQMRMNSHTFLKLIRVLIFRKKKGGNTWPFKTKFPNFLFNLVSQYILAHRPAAPANLDNSPLSKTCTYLSLFFLSHCSLCLHCPFSSVSSGDLLYKALLYKGFLGHGTLEQFIPSSDPIPFSNCLCTSLCHSFCNSIVLTYFNLFYYLSFRSLYFYPQH